MGHEFLMSVLIYTTSRKLKNIDIKENSDSLLKISYKKKKKAIRKEMNCQIMQNAVTLK